MTASTKSAAPAADPQLSHRQILIVFSGLMLGMLLAALDQTIVATALPTIVASLHGASHLAWVVAAYLLAATVTTPLYGKFSDLHGRKGVFQFAIVVFLVGSALSGLAHNMNELIAFRAVQGLGAGGLIALAMAIVGDVVSPRQRGRYQGYFGAVFAFASAAGPLAGGFIAEHLSWRWVFYINLPIGAVALVVTSVVLRLPFRRVEHRIDYTGAALLVAGVSALLLVTEWGGSQYPWRSGVIIGLIAAGVVLIGGLVAWERRVPEPLLPPRLFRSDIFTVAIGMQFLQAMAMFGAIVFVPFYLQLAQGISPTDSGLLLLPFMGGMLVMSIASGQLVTRTGRYKIFPLMGTTLTALGMWLLTTVNAGTSNVRLGVFLATLGGGMGLVMQNTVLATQNAVAFRDLGTATSSLLFFRSLGAVFGTALFGAIFVNRFNLWLPRLLPASYARRIHATSSGLNITPTALHRLPVSVRRAVTESLVHAVHTVYWVAVPFAALTVVFAARLREIRLRDTTGMSPAGEADVTPAGAAGQAVADTATRLDNVG
ncbi:MAG TPA: MDR family MFS transporter [Acidimicrobiales bacterium]|nr:MDR family MFS transporter [Acidimicrobiales bacterium]